MMPYAWISRDRECYAFVNQSLIHSDRLVVHELHTFRMVPRIRAADRHDLHSLHEYD
jgi:hypothetical protein